MTLPKFLSGNKMLLLLGLLVAFPPLSIDMYLPAIPMLQKLWAAPLPVVNLTLVCFFATYAVCLLVYGPLSDRYGRRGPLMAGIGIYILASVWCAAAGSISALIAARVLQAAGAAAASSIGLAITKDVYNANEREHVLANIAIIMAVAPMVGPTFGGWVMAVASWRVIFMTQAAVGLIAAYGVYRMPETIKEASSSNFRQVAGSYGYLLRNGRYVGITVLMSASVLMHFAFIASSSDVYITRFGVSEQVFGYFFALNATALMLGSQSFKMFRKRLGSNGLLIIGFSGVALGGLMMVLQPLPGPWNLALPMALASYAFGLSRPSSNNLVLEQVDRHAGAASSLMIFSYFMFGAAAMWLISLDWGDKVAALGTVGVLCGGGVLVAWLLTSRIFLAPVKAE